MAEVSGENHSGVRANIAVDGQGWFKAVSPQFLDLIGREVEGLVGVNLVDLVHPRDAAHVRVFLSDVAGGSQSRSIVARLFVADDRWMQTQGTVRVVAEGRITIDLIEHMPTTADSADAGDGSSYRALIPDDDVPDLRIAVRASAGDVETPVLEIDLQGRTVFVAGAWSTLTTGDATGSDVFEELLELSGQGQKVGDAIDAALGGAEASRHEIRVAGLPPRWVRILPIPSPHRAGVVHALIAVVPESDLRDAVRIAAPTVQPAVQPLAVASLPDEPPPESLPGAHAYHDGAVGDDADTGSVVATEVASDPVALDSKSATEVASDSVALDSKSGTEVASDSVALDSKSGTEVALDSKSAAEVASDSVALDSKSAAEVALDSKSAADEIEMLASPGRATQLLYMAGGLLTYLAMQGLYLGPAYDWPSPLQGLLDSQQCLVQPLCDNNVLRANHLAAFALAAAIAVFAVLFVRVGPLNLVTSRPRTANALARTSWQLNRSGPGIFAWLSVLALLIVTVQTLAFESVSTNVWMAATAFGAIAAWRADRDAALPLGSTMSALALALSCLLVPLGIGTIWLAENRFTGVAILIAGVGFFAYALRLNHSGHSSFDRFDYSAMLGFSVLALVLGLLRHRTWRYAFIGDEWSFYEGAVDGLRGNARLGTFDIGGPNDYFTGLTFELQGAVMRVAGDDVWGWRLSALMPMVLSVAAMYAFTRWLSGRTAAIAAASALATGHMLLSFSMVGYNNSQSLVAVSASFAALAWAHQRPSALRFFLLGSAVGSTFLVYAMARLALVPVGLLFLVLFRDNLASLARRLGWATLGGLAMAAPALFNWANWEALLKATPVEAEDPVLAAGGVGRQMLQNILTGWLSFIGSTRNTHFVVGPHLDVLSAVLLIIGLGFTIARARTDKALRWFLVGGVALWTAVNAIQQYAEISNTRSFMIPLVYCVFIGIGVAAVLPIVLDRVSTPEARGPLAVGSLALFAIVLVALNQWHIGSHANERQQLTEQAILLQQFELTESVDGQGMQVHVGWREQKNARLNMVLRAHDVAPERIVVVPIAGSLNFDRLCGQTEPAMVLMHREHPQATAWTDTMASCWNTTTVEVFDPAGALKLLRVTNDAGGAEFTNPASQRVMSAAATNDFSVTDAIDVATDGAGTGFALSRSADGARIHRLDGGGSFTLAQRQPIDFDITSDGLFVVAANGGDDRLVWYDGNGNIVHRYQGQQDFPQLGGLTVDGDRLWVSDTTRSRLIAFDDELKAVEIRFAESVIIEPSSLATAPDGGIWTFSSRTGEVMLVDAADKVTLRISAQVFNPVDAPRLASTRDGWLIRTVPERPIVELVAPSGEVIDARGGIQRPQAAATRTNELLVVDPRWNELPVIAVDDRWAPATRGTISWGTRSVSAGANAIYDSPFIGDELLESGPITTELLETQSVDTGDGQLWRQIGTAIIGEVHAIANAGSDGGVYVADVNGRVVQLDAQGAARTALSLGAANTAFVSDLVHHVDRTWALDAGAGGIVRIDTDGSVIRLEADPNFLRNARGIGAGADASLWVASTADAQLTNIALDGSYLSEIALSGRQPTDVVEVDGGFWFVDAQELELVKIDASGATLTELGLEPFTSLESPHLVIVGDRLWVTEPETSAVFAVDLATGEPSGERIELVRPDGSDVGKAIGITATPDGRLWISDSRGGAIVMVDP